MQIFAIYAECSSTVIAELVGVANDLNLAD